MDVGAGDSSGHQPLPLPMSLRHCNNEGGGSDRLIIACFTRL